MAHRKVEQVKKDNECIEEYVKTHQVNYNTAIIKLLEQGKISNIKRQSHHESYSIYKKSKEVRVGKQKNYNREESQNYKVVEMSLNKKYKDVMKIKILWLFDENEQQGACARILNIKTGKERSLRTETDLELFDKIAQIYKNQTR